ncbi:MAG: GxxExxY protein [Bacteroidales bacterium]|nr:GxxExxY protein [Bacteroidales bacterium]
MYDIVGALYEVHRELGPGLNEYCYQEGLELELSERGIPFARELSLHPNYHGRQMKAEYRIGFLCKNDIIVECKSVSDIIPEHRAQLYNYMRLCNASCGILVNFANKMIEIERYFFDKEDKSIISTDGNIMYRRTR